MLFFILETVTVEQSLGLSEEDCGGVIGEEQGAELVRDMALMVGHWVRRKDETTIGLSMVTHDSGHQGTMR